MNGLENLMGQCKVDEARKLRLEGSGMWGSSILTDFWEDLHVGLDDGKPYHGMYVFALIGIFAKVPTGLRTTCKSTASQKKGVNLT